MPGSMSAMLDQLGATPDERSLASLAHSLSAGRQLPAPQGVFPRHIEDAA